MRHEQAGTHAADGYARATGKMGVMIASTGPGTSNTVTGLYESQFGSSRVLVITGQADTTFYGKGLSYVHEAEKQIQMLSSVCRRVESPRHISQLADSFKLWFPICLLAAPARSDRNSDRFAICQYKKVAIELPSDNIFEADPSVISRVADKIKEVSKRIFVVGGGVISSEATQELCELAEQLDAPVLTTVDGRVLPEDHRLCMGNYYNSAGIYSAIQDVDLTIAIGTKFAVEDGQFHEQTPPGELIQIDIDGNMIGRTHKAAIGVLSDAKSALNQLKPLLSDLSQNDSQFNESLFQAREGVQTAMRARLGRIGHR